MWKKLLLIPIFLFSASAFAQNSYQPFLPKGGINPSTIISPSGYGATSTFNDILNQDQSNTNSLGYRLLYGNSPTGSSLYKPTVACSGNGSYGQGSAYGAFCFNAKSNPALETYLGQIKMKNVTPATNLTYNLTTYAAATSGATTIDLTPTIVLKSGYTYTVTGTGIASGTKVSSVSQDSGGSSTTVTLSTAITADIASGASIVITASNGMGSTDVVGLYVGVDNNSSSYSGGQWAVNFLSQDNLDGGGTGASMAEFDQNNFNCDNPDPDGNYYTLSTGVRKTRSDHSACPGHGGILVTGLAGYTSGTALSISGVGSRAMWEDGIDMISGYAIGSSEIRTDTLSRYNWKIGGSHTFGIDMSEATYGYAPIHLAKDNVNGRIMWDCPKAGCATNITSRTTGIMPETDGTLALQSQGAKFLGGDSYHQGGLGIDITLSGSTTSAPNDWSFMTWSSGSYNFSFTNGVNLTNVLIMNQSNATFGVPIVSSKGTIHTPVTFSSLPSSPSTGEEEWCSDCYATSNTNKKLGIPVWYDGTNWIDSLGYTASH